MPNRIQVLIVDDEPLARLGLRRLIEATPGYGVVGECRDGVEALESIRTHHPDIVLLDIEMPEMGAFDVLEALGERHRPAVILITAYAQHGLDAFDAGVLDYVLKPVDPERLDIALRRASAASERTEEPRYTTRIVAKLAGRVRVLPVNEIHWIEAAGSYVRLHTATGEVLHRESLSYLDEQLDPAAFVRIHRSTIVALDEIEQLSPAGHGDATVRLRQGHTLTVSRRYRKGLAERLAP